MKFAKTIETNSRELPEEWQPYVIQYKLLKKNIKQIVHELDATFRRLDIAPPAVGSGTTPPPAEADSSATAPGDVVVPPSGSVPEGVAYCIEKDGNGLVHPVLRINLRRPSPPPPPPPCLSEEGTSIHAEDDSLRGPEPEPATCAPGAAEDANTQVVVRLEADQLFFDQLVAYIRRIEQFGQRYMRAYTTNVDHMGADLATVTSPYKHDYPIWREIFRLYMDAGVWSHSEGDYRPQSTAREGRERFAGFAKHIEAVGLARQFRNPTSALLLMSFYKINMELTHMLLLQEMNEQAARKIIKKHDKRTHLVAMTQFPHLMTVDTESLTRALVHTIYGTIVGIVPQIDDYSCPMCLSIAWRPLRLQCGHLFCSRCVAKASRRHLYDCPMCRSKGAVYNAGAANVDHAMLNFLQLYFPKEIRDKQRDIQQDISDEETRALVPAQARDRQCHIQ